MPGIAVIGNPVARRFDRAVDAVLREAAACGVDACVLRTDPLGMGRPQAAHAVRAGADAVVVVGGDGTVRGVAAALAHTGMPLGIVPAGTANLFARNLDLPRSSPAAAARIAISGRDASVDLGRIAVTRTGGTREPEQPFLIVAGVGHDALAIEAASLRAKRRLGWLSYIEAGARRLRHPSVAVRVRFDGGETASTHAWSVLVHNAARIPAGLSVLHGTRLDDGCLHIATVSPRHLAHWGRIAAAGAGLARAGGVLRHQRAQHVVIGAVDEPLPAQIDGDSVGRVTRLDARIDVAALRVRIPERVPGERMPRSRP